MPQHQRPYSLEEIRQLLERIFDDAGLDAFCLDHFEEVYDRFARGLQKTEKLTMLLSYCRAPERYQTLLKALHACSHPEVQTFFIQKRIALTNKRVENERSLPLADYDAVMPSNFDLDELMIECLGAVFSRQGLIGLLLPCYSMELLKNLCERLKREWDRIQVCVKPSLSLNSIHTPQDLAIYTITERYALTLQAQDVICAVQCAAKGIVEPFWQTLCQALRGKNLGNRLVVIMAIHEDCTLPSGTIELKRPDFKEGHVIRWVKQVVQSRGWPEQLVHTWTHHILETCGHNHELQIDWVYEHLQAMGELLQHNPSPETLQQELNKRREWYVQTSD